MSKPPKMPTITVVTPTYQRATTLPRAYQSLLEQTCSDFEWIVVDDGSDDGTRKLVQDWIGTSPFPISYVFQENRGKHVAENVGAAKASGKLMATLESDDWYLPHAIASFLELWESIPSDEQQLFVGGVALCAYPDGSIVGSRFPADPLDTTYGELRTIHSVTGDKAGFGRVDVVRQFPHPVFEGERLVAEGVQYSRIGRHYLLRCVNQIVKVNDYRPGGLTDMMGELLQENPRTAMLLEREFLIDGASWLQRCKAHAKLTRYALHAKRPTDTVRMSTSKTLTILSAPLGLALYIRDRLRRPRLKRD
jgi:glycosyltransferase involved in cell wall biosynthesis